MNNDLIEQNVHRLLGAMTGAATTAMVAVGDQLGLYRALADGGPATQDELAARTGTAARYLREWLSQQAAAGFIAYQADDGRYVIFASKAGAPENPGWYHNLKANPETTVEVGTETIPVRAEEASGEERDRLYSTQAERIPQFAEYQEKAGRTIPVMVLTPR